MLRIINYLGFASLIHVATVKPLFTLQVPIVTNINFLLTISIQCQEIRL